MKLKNKLNLKSLGVVDKIIFIFTNRYIIHILILVIAVSVATSNIMAYENEEDYGRNALIYEIIGLENIEIFEEDSSIIRNEEPQIQSYLGESSQLTRGTFSEAQKLEEDVYEQQYETDLATTQGGGTLIKPDLVSTEAAKITRTSIKEYIVESGDTIGAIAENFNISVNTILWANNLSSYSFIKPGQKLTLPPTSGVLHTIAKGDTISKIASKYNANISQIKQFNNIDNNTLSVGETIMVPGGRIIYTAKPRSYIESPVSAPAYTAPTVADDGQMYWPEECHYITQYYRGWLHTGVDIACGFGKPIRAAEAGVVSKVAYLNYGYGYHVIIDHGGGKQTLYGHFSKIYVKKGDKIEKAQVIGAEGSTGQSTGSHLHFEVRINGQRLNPLNYIR